ncbi:hypothetical protein MKW98_023619 [Papaver atlanticum]|uniref:DUF538 domain-containing protein n=1 Tax=Papaver atlanticum TaxID=357466 RepID=A0AAD4SWZ2_9MAGN|nr:hypothetical protein MKW98_023619 [Papaver atlanticum]
MSSASQTFLLFMILLCLTSSAIIPSTAVNFEDDIRQSAYEVIQGYGFPAGLLPVGVKAYELDNNSGKFALHLGEGACSFPIFGYEIKYEPTFTGIISNGKLTNLNGISVKVLSFYWVSIFEVLKRDELQFSVGIVSVNFPIDNFYDSPNCGCGLNCRPIVDPLIVSSS